MKPSSRVQIRAFRSNGALSCGPITAEGKRPSRNGAIHGLCSTPVVLSNKSAEDFETPGLAIVREYIDAFHPRNRFELELVREMAVGGREQRILTIEKRIMTEKMPGMSPIRDEIIPDNAILNEVEELTRERTRERTQSAAAFWTLAQNSRREQPPAENHPPEDSRLPARRPPRAPRNLRKVYFRFRTQLMISLWVPQSEHRKTFMPRRSHASGKWIRCIFALKYHFFDPKTTRLSNIGNCKTAGHQPVCGVAGGPIAPPGFRQLAGDLNGILFKALEKDPLRRFTSDAEFSDDVRRHLEGWPVGATRNIAWHAARTFLARKTRSHRPPTPAPTLRHPTSTTNCDRNLHQEPHLRERNCAQVHGVQLQGSSRVSAGGCGLVLNVADVGVQPGIDSVGSLDIVVVHGKVAAARAATRAPGGGRGRVAPRDRSHYGAGNADRAYLEDHDLAAFGFVEQHHLGAAFSGDAGVEPGKRADGSPPERVRLQREIDPLEHDRVVLVRAERRQIRNVTARLSGPANWFPTRTLIAPEFRSAVDSALANHLMAWARTEP
jgi:hypothetical protein